MTSQYYDNDWPDYWCLNSKDQDQMAADLKNDQEEKEFFKNYKRKPKSRVVIKRDPK